MKPQHNIPSTKNRRQHKVSLLLSGLALLLLLSACNIAGGSTSSSKPANTSANSTASMLTPSLKSQGDAQLQTYQQWITLMKQYGGDVTTYQQQYTSDQQTLKNASSPDAYKSDLTTITAHIETIKLPTMKAEAVNLQQKLHQQVTDWGQQHKYHNAFDNTDYPLGYEYGDKGIGSWVQDDLQAADTVAKYQQAIENLNMFLVNFQTMMTNASDKTPYNQQHATDIQLMQQNNKMESKAIIVSLSEQAMRVYDHGKLVNSFLVTTGRPDRPSIPGVWWVEGKQSPTVFKAGVPKSDPGWYPDTPINYAMQYHSNGYFLHDSWWRNDYGPGTNFPHEDSGGDSFSSQGSHGCVNLSKDNTNWVYNFVEIYTRVIIY